MRYFLPAFFLFFCLTSSFAQLANNPRSITKKGILPQGFSPTKIGFIENKGQIVDQLGNQNKEVLFLLNTEGLNVQLRQNGFSYDTYQVVPASGEDSPGSKLKNEEARKRITNYHRIDISFEGVSNSHIITPIKKSIDEIRYSRGSDIVVHHFNEVVYQNLYPNIDLRFYISELGQFEYDFIVHAGADPSNIQLRYDGQLSISKTSASELALKVAHGEMLEQIPNSYLQGTDKRIDVAYHQKSANVFQFSVPAFDRTKTLVIDPAPNRQWATYFGGSGSDGAESVSTDASNNIYVSGYTFSTGAIATVGVYQTTLSGSSDGFLAKFTPAGIRSFSTYFGGPGDETIFALLVNSSGEIFMTGATTSISGVATSGTEQTFNAGLKDAMLIKFQSGGTISWATYYGGAGDEYGYDITMAFGDPIITGLTKSNNLPTLLADQSSYGGGTADAFLAAYDPSDGSLLYSTYLGGDGYDAGTKVISDSNGQTYISGITNSTASSGLVTFGSAGGGSDAFLAKFDLNSTLLKTWAVYFGGAGDDEGLAITLDVNDAPYMAGSTASSGINAGGPNPGSYAGGTDGFIAKFNPSTGAAVLSTYYGGSGDEKIWSLVADNTNIFGCGETTSASGIATTGAYQTSLSAGYDGFFFKYDLSGNKVYGSYYGGPGSDGAYYNTIDAAGNLIFIGATGSSSGIAAGTVHQTVFGTGTYDAFLAKFDNLPAPTISSFTPSGAFAATVTITGTNFSATPANNTVKFNGTPAVVTLSSATSITTTVPAGATTGVITVAVDGQTGTSSTSFTVSGSMAAEPTNSPTLLNFTGVTSTSYSFTFTAAAAGTTAPDGYIGIRSTGVPSNGVLVDGITYSIGQSLGNGSVRFNAAIAASYSESDGAPSTEYFFSIYSYKGSGSSINYKQIGPLTGSVITLSGSSAPNITGFTPTSGAVGASVTINGSGFSSTLASNTVKFGGTAATNITSSNASFIVAVVPAGASSGTISVTVSSQTGTSTGIFTVLATEPTAQPTSILFSAVTDVSMTVSFTAASPPPTGGYIAIRKPTSPPTTAVLVDGTTYAAGQTLGDGTVAYVGGSTSFPNTGLAANTTYYYTIYAFNGSAAAINYLTATPLPGNRITNSSSSATEPTNSPTGPISFTSVTASSYSFSFTAAAAGTVAADGYIGLRKAGSAPTSVPVDGTTYTADEAFGDGFVNFIGTGTVYNQTTGTLPVTTYYHVIYSYKGSGSSIDYKQVSPLTGNVTTKADETLPLIGANTTPVSVKAGEAIKVSITITDPESAVTSAEITYGESSSFDWTLLDQPMVKNGNLWEFTIPGGVVKDLGVEYIVTAYNGAGGSSDTGILGVTITADQNGFSVPFAGGGTAQTNYRIVSVPLALEAKTIDKVFGDDLGNYGDKSKWRMFRYSGGKTNELSGSSSINPGEGYWLISSENALIDSGPGKTVGRISSPFTMSITQGFNQIGNPYVFNLVWADVKTYSFDTKDNTTLGLGDLKVYTGSFGPGPVLKKYEGGFVMATTAGTLVFPAEKKSGAGRIEEKPAVPVHNAIDGLDWEVNFDLSNGIQTMNFSGIGMNKKASDGYDKFDDFTLPRFVDFIELNHASKELFKLSYTKDIVPSAEDHTWEFNVESNADELMTMKWDNSFFGSNDKQLVLWDVSQQRGFNMRSISQYIFNKSRSGHFKVFYGDEKYIKEKTAVNQVLFHDVFPNPATDKVTISFSLPTDDHVTIQVIDLLGRKVATVANGDFKRGYHEVSWNVQDDAGNAVTNGIYITQIKSLNSDQQKRLSITK